jgi:hypothetical protein
MTFTAAAGSTGGVGGRQRRSDKVAARVMVLLMAVFLDRRPRAVGGGCPRGGYAAAALRAARSWCQVPAVLLQAAPSPTTAADALFGNSLGPGWWTAPDGRRRTGRIRVSPGLAAGRTARLWVEAAGSPAGPSASYRARVADEALAAAVAPVVLGIVLWWLAWAGRWVLDRRRLADWEAAWSAVGPQWTQRFWSQSQP